MFDNLSSLRNLTEIDVLITGDWGFPQHGNRTWHGEAIADTPIVGIIFLSCDGRMFWAKSSRPASNQLAIELRLHPTWNTHIQLLYSIGFALNSIHDATTALSSEDYLPEIPHSKNVRTGQLFTFASFQSAPPTKLYLMLLAKQDVQVKRKYIWRLRQGLLTGLVSPLLDVFTYGRQGSFPIP